MNHYERDDISKFVKWGCLVFLGFQITFGIVGVLIVSSAHAAQKCVHATSHHFYLIKTVAPSTWLMGSSEARDALLHSDETEEKSTMLDDWIVYNGQKSIDLHDGNGMRKMDLWAKCPREPTAEEQTLKEELVFDGLTHQKSVRRH